MMNIPFNPYLGHRNYINISAKVIEIKVGRPLKNWFRKTPLIIASIDKDQYKEEYENVYGEKQYPPETIKIYDNGDKLSDVQVGSMLAVKIGHASSMQQYYGRLYPFVIEEVSIQK